MLRNIILKIKNLQKIYRTDGGTPIQALKGVNLDIHKGEILGLLGPNGAGKSTLAALLTTMYPPTHGDVLFQDRSIYELIDDFRYKFGFCPQKPNLYNLLTIRQNLWASGKYYDLDDATLAHRIEHYSKQYNLEPYLDRFMTELSGGYKQRASIVRSILHKPAIVLLDEPTVGLDPHIRRKLWQEIKSLKAEGITVILTTHYLDEAEALSDRICVLDKGEIKFCGTVLAWKEEMNSDSLEDIMVSLFESEV